MISALVYLQFHSFVNRLGARFRRLKQPKYFIGAIVGGLYFWFAFVRFWFVGAMGNTPFGGRSGVLPEDPVLAESIAALVLLVIVVLNWFLPKNRAALTFSEAEIAFLFPAPITRRGLIHYKLARSQTAILFSTLFLALFSGRWRAAGGTIWPTIFGMWVILSTLNLHFLAASFVRTMLLDRGVTIWKRRVAILAIIIVGLGAILIWAHGTLPPLRNEDLKSLDSVINYLRELLVAGPLPYLLYPFRLVVRPFLSHGFLQFVVALGPALAVMALNYAWVVRANVAFEEGSIEVSQRIAQRIAAVRRDPWQARSKPKKARRPPFMLAPTGPPAVAILWKNLIAAGHLVSARIWFALIWITFVMTMFISSTNGGRFDLTILGGLAVGLLGMSLFFGAQILRQDFRQDLAVVEALKAYPLRGAQVVLGELLAPTAILTALQWILIVVAVGFFAPPNDKDLTWQVRVSIGAASAILAPGFNLISLIIPNGATLLFPGWVRSGPEGFRGIEATGQMMIAVFAQIILLVLSAVPPAIAFAVIFIGGRYLAGWIVAMPMAAIAGLVVLLGEASVGILLLGRLFERLDVSSELGP